jgi:thioredoxin domain-containing protein 5
MIKLIFTVFLIVVSHQHEFREDTPVMILNTSNFDNTTFLVNETSKPSEPWFIMFYADWCGHCKRLIPSWEELATQLQGKTYIGAVNCEENTYLRDRFGIKGFPTLLFFDKEGVMYKYKGERSVEKLGLFVGG